MSKPLVPYVVQHGDHLRGLAFRFGFDPDAIWNDQQNAALASKRKDRDMICAGDVLFVPADAAPGLPLTVGSSNSYTAEVPKTHVVLHVDAKPLERVANKPFEVHGAGGPTPIAGTVGGDGKIEFDVPVTVRSVDVHLPDAGMRFDVRVGELDPIDERSGVVQRLRTLGLLHDTKEIPDEILREAIVAFQRSGGLQPDGELTAETVDALRNAHKS